MIKAHQPTWPELSAHIHTMDQSKTTPQWWLRRKEKPTAPWMLGKLLKHNQTYLLKKELLTRADHATVRWLCKKQTPNVVLGWQEVLTLVANHQARMLSLYNQIASNNDSDNHDLV